MHTLRVIAAGLVLLGICLLAGRMMSGGAKGMSRGALYFIPIWLVLAVTNLWVGVSSAGYTVAQELPILLLVFGLPATIAAVLWRRLA